MHAPGSGPASRCKYQVPTSDNVSIKGHAKDPPNSPPQIIQWKEPDAPEGRPFRRFACFRTSGQRRAQNRTIPGDLVEGTDSKLQ